MISEKEFRELVSDVLAEFPEKYLSRLRNVAVVTEREPTEAQLGKEARERGETLLGLYEGIPLTLRGDGYGIGVVIPDKITLFQDPIVAEADGDRDVLREIIRETLWHEIAHYFGYDDEEIERREDAGTNHP